MQCHKCGSRIESTAGGCGQCGDGQVRIISYGPLPSSLPFHQWLSNQDRWVIAVAQSDTVYQAMKLSYEANSAIDNKGGNP